MKSKIEIAPCGSTMSMRKKQKRRCSKWSFATSEASLDDVMEDPLSSGTLHEIAGKARGEIYNKFRSMPNYEIASRRLQCCPKFDFKQLELGVILGKGVFGCVTEVKGMRISESRHVDYVESPHAHNQIVQFRCLENETSRFQEGKPTQFAIKTLQGKSFVDKDAYYSAARDMAVEAYLLASLDHPFILKLRGLSNEPLGDKNCFLMFDRLYGTLTDRLEEWTLREHVLSRGLRRIMKPKSCLEKLKELQETRLQIMFDLASAVAHLHERHIIDRDLKPENIGFDINGDLKLFDFGLSTEVDPSWSKPYNLTGMTGSLAYMAPEVHMRQPYDETCDIYSLSLIFWKTFTLKPLFPLMNSESLREWVIKRGVRPFMAASLSNTLQALITSMWDPSPSKRPSAAQVTFALTHELSFNSSACKENRFPLKAKRRALKMA